MPGMTNSGATFEWARLLARAALTATGVGLTLMMLVALTTQFAMAEPAMPANMMPTDWPWVSWLATSIGLLILAMFGAGVLTFAHRLIDPN